MPAIPGSTGTNFYRLATKLAGFGFVAGAGMELFMVKVKIGGRNFYDVAIQKKAERIVDAREEEAERRRELAHYYGSKDSTTTK